VYRIDSGQKHAFGKWIDDVLAYINGVHFENKQTNKKVTYCSFK